MGGEDKLKILRKLFNEIDPAGIFFDENIDEYDSEIKELISLSPDYSNIEELRKLLEGIFARYFEGIKIDHNTLHNLAKEISVELNSSVTMRLNHE